MDFRVFGVCVKLGLKTFKNSGQFFCGFYLLKIQTLWNSLAVQWLELGAFCAEGLGSIPGQGTKISQASRPKKKRYKLSFIHLAII